MCASESGRFTGIALTLVIISASLKSVRRCVTLMHVLERENHPNRQEGRAKNQGGEC